MIAADRPQLRAGTEFIGEFQGSASKQPSFLARRWDGNIVRMSELPYLVALHIDGARDCEEIAELVSERAGRKITPTQVSYLVRTKLQSSGLTEGEGSVAMPQRPMLALRPRGVLIPGRVVVWIAHILRPFFLTPVVVAVLLGALVVDAWLLAHANLGAAIEYLLRHPWHLPLVIGLGFLSSLFHECGHATGLRYGGAKPGAIGAGIYIIWLAFYSDVTDAYRLDRRGRLRVDLGGVYFQGMFALATAIGYLLTEFEPLLLVTFFIYVTIAQQFMPFLRLDGYYVVSDLIGVPELFPYVRPTLASLFRRSTQQGHPATELRRWARLAVATWVALAVPALALFFTFIVAYTPLIVTTSFDVLRERLSEMMAADGSLINVSVSAFLAALGLAPIVGLSLLYLRITVAGFRLCLRFYRRLSSRGGTLSEEATSPCKR